MEDRTSHVDADCYDRMVREMYEKYGTVTLPPEYSYYVRENMLQFLIRLARYKFVAKHLSISDDILEVGCGSGLGTLFLSQFCRSVTAIDCNSQWIEEACALNTRENVSFQVRDFTDFTADQGFDALVSLDVLEHLSVEEGKKFIGRAADMIKADGMLVIGTPSLHSYEYQGELSRAAHVKCYDLSELKDLISGSFGRVLTFSMNDEIVHTGHPKMAWYYFVLAFYPR